MQAVPPWLIAMFAGVLAAAAAGAAGTGPLLALLAAAAAGAIVLRALRDRPWTPAGRAAWQRSARRWADLARRLGRRLGPRRAPPGRRDAAEAPGTPPWVPPGSPRTVPDSPPAARVPVRCEVATERLQVWHSTVTRRAYEVPAEHGLEGARPGALADLVFERGRPRVVPRRLN